MILNPVIQGGGTEKEYKITNKNSYFLFQETASAGEIVVSKKRIHDWIYGRYYFNQRSIDSERRFYKGWTTHCTSRNESESVFYHASRRCHSLLTSPEAVVA